MPAPDNTQQPQGVPSVVDPNAPIPGPVVSQQPAVVQQQQQRQSKVITIPTHAMSEVKKKEFQRGQQAAMKQLDLEAQALGFKDFEDMKRSKRNQPTRVQTQQQPQRPQGNGGGGNNRPNQQRTQGAADPRVQQRLQQLEDDKRKANRRAAQEERRRKDAERALLAQEATHEMKLMAMRAGVKDVDYAVSLLQRRTAAMSNEQLEAYDEDQFFAVELRKSHPYLYGETVQPAQTTPAPTQAGGQGTPLPATPPPQTPPTLKDAREMTKAEYQKQLESMGLADPGLVTSIPS